MTGMRDFVFCHYACDADLAKIVIPFVASHGLVPRLDLRAIPDSESVLDRLRASPSTGDMHAILVTEASLALPGWERVVDVAPAEWDRIVLVVFVDHDTLPANLTQLRRADFERNELVGIRDLCVFGAPDCARVIPSPVSEPKDTTLREQLVTRFELRRASEPRAVRNFVPIEGRVERLTARVEEHKQEIEDRHARAMKSVDYSRQSCGRYGVKGYRNVLRDDLESEPIQAFYQLYCATVQSVHSSDSEDKARRKRDLAEFRAQIAAADPNFALFGADLAIEIFRDALRVSYGFDFANAAVRENVISSFLDYAARFLSFDFEG